MQAFTSSPETSSSTPTTTLVSPKGSPSPTTQQQHTAPPTSPPPSNTEVISKAKLQELVTQIDPTEKLDPEVEEVRYQTIPFCSLSLVASTSG